MFKWVAVSGGFDPIHLGHIEYIKAARKLGNRLMVILNRDDWLIAKKGYVFMPYEEREAILLAIRYVDEVVPQIDVDNTVCYSLEVYKPDIFAKGGDSTQYNVPELGVCIENGIELIFGVGGSKIQSSSWLAKQTIDPNDEFFEQCGRGIEKNAKQNLVKRNDRNT